MHLLSKFKDRSVFKNKYEAVLKCLGKMSRCGVFLTSRKTGEPDRLILVFSFQKCCISQSIILTI